MKLKTWAVALTIAIYCSCGFIVAIGIGYRILLAQSPAMAANSKLTQFSSSPSSAASRTTLRNPIDCATPEHLVFRTSKGVPSAEFYSCNGTTLSAVIDYKIGKTPALYGIPSSLQEAVLLRKAFPKQTFLAPKDDRAKWFRTQYMVGYWVKARMPR